ncbi:hypothetical protein GCM10010279_43720 [Streptomyces mutabilis]|nr:hypothetical protein GCM10010279_43720 [Streptomyces mutabilis]
MAGRDIPDEYLEGYAQILTEVCARAPTLRHAHDACGGDGFLDLKPVHLDLDLSVISLPIHLDRPKKAHCPKSTPQTPAYRRIGQELLSPPDYPGPRPNRPNFAGAQREPQVPLHRFPS